MREESTVERERETVRAWRALPRSVRRQAGALAGEAQPHPDPVVARLAAHVVPILNARALRGFAVVMALGFLPGVVGNVIGVPALAYFAFFPFVAGIAYFFLLFVRDAPAGVSFYLEAVNLRGILADAAPLAKGIELVVPRRLDTRVPVIVTVYWATFASTFFTEDPFFRLSPFLGAGLTASVLVRWWMARKNPRPPIRIDRAGLTFEAQERVVPWASIAVVGVAGGWNVRPRRHRLPAKVVWQLTDGTWFAIDTARIALSAEQVVLATHSFGVPLWLSQQQPMPAEPPPVAASG